MTGYTGLSTPSSSTRPPRTNDGVDRMYLVGVFAAVVGHFAGTYRHHLSKTDEGYKIKLQRVDLINAEGPFEYVLQFWL